MTPFEKYILLHVSADYSWTDAGIVRIGESGDLAACAVGDFKGRCLIFCHGNGETAVSERYWFERLAAAGVSVICPDYRGYGLSSGELSERGCYEAAHAAYEWLANEKRVPASRISVLGYSLGSAVAVELATTAEVASLILQSPFLGGAALRPVWERRRGVVPSDEPETTFPTQARLPSVRVPTLVIHGTADSVIPFEQGKTVSELIASRRKRFVPVEGADHCNFQFFLGEKYVPLMVGFLEGGKGMMRRILDKLRPWRVVRTWIAMCVFCALSVAVPADIPADGCWCHHDANARVEPITLPDAAFYGALVVLVGLFVPRRTRPANNAPKSGGNGNGRYARRKTPSGASR